MNPASILAAAIGVSCAAAGCLAQVAFGPGALNIELSREWFDTGGGLLASSSTSSGALSYGPITAGAVASPSITFPTNALASAGQPAWMSYGEGRSVIEQSGNSQTMRVFANSVCITQTEAPSVGHGTISVLVVHTVDFQLGQASPWQGYLSTVLSLPMSPNLKVVRDPTTAPVTVVDQTLAASPSMMQEYAGMLAPGSYRVVLTFPLTTTSPGDVGGVHSATAIFVVPAPASAGCVLGAAVCVLGRRRRRAG